MNNKYLIANFKTNKNLKDVQSYFETLSSYLVANPAKDLNITVMLNHLHILSGMKWAENFSVGSQSGIAEDSGSYTSAVSIKQLVDEKVEWILLGHSEEFAFFHETIESVNKKLLKAIAGNMKVVLCFGETVKDEFEKTVKTLESQLADMLINVDWKNIGQIIFAYEPRWAIGFGHSLGQDKANEIIGAIKKFLVRQYREEPKVLYGGSVKLDTIEGYMKEENIDGVLVGKEALDVDNFIKMIKVSEATLEETKDK